MAAFIAAFDSAEFSSLARFAVLLSVGTDSVTELVPSFDVRAGSSSFGRSSWLETWLL